MTKRVKVGCPYFYYILLYYIFSIHSNKKKVYEKKKRGNKIYFLSFLRFKDERIKKSCVCVMIERKRKRAKELSNDDDNNDELVLHSPFNPHAKKKIHFF